MSSTANSGTKVALLLRKYCRCGSFPLFSAPNSLFSIWTDLKRPDMIPGASTLRLGEWIWLTGPSRLYRNSPKGLNSSSIKVLDQIRDPKNSITLRPIFYIIHIIYRPINYFKYVTIVIEFFISAVRLKSHTTFIFVFKVYNV